MNRKKRYGVWNTKKKEFQFGICEPSKTKARKRLFEKIGKDAYKYRFQIKELKIGNPKAEKLLTIEIGGDNMTNAERIRNMSDEELAEFLSVHDLGLKGNDLPMLTDWFEWLQSEAE
jgi:hypothetical protein